MPNSAALRSSKDAGYVSAILTAATASAVCTYLFDPAAGRKRRAILRDKSARGARILADGIESAVSDARHRTRGLLLRTAGLFLPDAVDNSTLESRVRAKLGRICSHPRAIAVTADNGRVRLRGDILERELERVIGGVSSVRGVRDISSNLSVYKDASHVPHLQGGRDPAANFGYLRQSWAPAPRLLAGMTGASLIASGLLRRSGGGWIGALGGALLLTRSLCDTPLPRRGALKRGVHIDKSIHIYAEPDEVYALWRDPQRFPQFMTHVKSVRKIGDNLYHWRVTGPAGVPVEWNAEISDDVPGELLAWRTVQGAPVHSVGVVRFEPDPFGGTHLHIRMSYNPPADQLGHALAKAFGADPRRQLDDDMMRFKSLLEVGKTRTEEGGVVRQ